MSGKPMWMDYVDLGLKVTVPLTVVFATIWFNASADERRKDESRAAEERRQRSEIAERVAKRRQDELWFAPGPIRVRGNLAP
jgi:hypothetical protein